MAGMRRRNWRAGVAAGVGLAALSAGWAVGADGQPREGERARERTGPGGDMTATRGLEGAPQPEEVTLSEARERALGELMDLTQDADAQVRANAVEGLSQVPARARRVLPAALSDANVGVRAVAGMVAGRQKERELAGAIRPLVREEAAIAQISGIYALARIGEAADVSRLARFLLDHPEVRVRAQAAFVLGELGEKSAAGLLAEAAASGSARGSAQEVRAFRLQIAEALTKLGDEEQLSVLRAALYPASPEDLEAAAAAAQILGELRDKESVGILVSLAKGPGETERVMPAEVRLAAAEALAKMGYRDGGYIAREYLGSENPVLRAQAASVAGWVRDRGLLPELLRMMDEDGSGVVRVSAAAAVVRLTGK